MVEYVGLHWDKFVGIFLFFAGYKANQIKNKRGEADIFIQMTKGYKAFVEDTNINIESLKKDVINVQFELSNAVKKADVWEMKYNNLLDLYTKLKKDFDKLKLKTNGVTT